MLQEFLAPGELDPLNRRLCAEKKPDVVVQVATCSYGFNFHSIFEVLTEELK